MTKIQLLEREIEYQSKVYRGKTRKYKSLVKELKFYKTLFIIILLRINI